MLRFVFVVFLALVASLPASGFRLCGTRLTSLLTKTCTFRNQSLPCFTEDPKGELGGGVAARFELAKLCCDEHCAVEDITAKCCFTIECLQHCYPESQYELRDGHLYSPKWT